MRASRAQRASWNVSRARPAGAARPAPAGGAAVPVSCTTRARTRSARPKSSSSGAPGSSAQTRSPWTATSPDGVSACSAVSSASSRRSAAARDSPACSTSAPTSPPRPKGSRRRCSSDPARSPRARATSTSPASRRAVVSATRRRRSSNATAVTPCWSSSRSASVCAPESFTLTSQAWGGPAATPCPVGAMSSTSVRAASSGSEDAIAPGVASRGAPAARRRAGGGTRATR